MKQYISLSSLSILFVVITITIMAFNLKAWDKEKVIHSDGKIYYSYLPAAFIYGDLYFDFSEQLPGIFGTTWTNRAANNNKVVKMTMGNAMLWSPFFGIANMYAAATDYDQDGFSKPYHFMISIATLFYLSLGLIFLRKLLLNYFNEVVVSLVIIMLVFGTNLVFYAVDEPAMSHINSFFLITTFVCLSLLWFEEQTILRSILLGIALGLVTLIRPTNVIIGLLPFLIWLLKKETFRGKILFVKKNAANILFVVLFAFLLFFPQLLYWKIITGDWLFYSYKNEGFFFNNPQIIDGLFSFRKGWLIYTPLMIFSIIGLFFMSGGISKFRYPILITTVVFVYIVFSWWCWWYGGSFGSRPMIDIYGMLAIPLATFVRYVVRQKIWIRVSAMLVISFFIILNLHQVKQYRSSLLHWDGMTREAYKAIFLKKHWPENYDELIKRPDYDKALAGEKENE